MGSEDFVRGILEKKGLSAIIISSPTNLSYVTGCSISTQRVIPKRTAYFLYRRNAQPAMLVCNIEESYARRASSVKDIRTYREHVDEPARVVASILEEDGSADGTVGIEEEFFTLDQLRRLSRALPTAKFEGIDGALGQRRAVKTEREIRIIGGAAKSTCDVIESNFKRIHEGMTELELAEGLAGGLMKSGAESIAFMTLGSGATRFVAHHHPEDKKIVRGELVHTDFGGQWSGYYSDLVRMACLGEPTADELRKFRTTFRAQRKVIEKMKPGVEVAELFGTCKRYLESEGHPIWLPHIGHSLGLELHEEPIIHPGSRQRIKENEVFCVEPGIWSKTDFYHLEDTVLVESDGVRFLSSEIAEDEYPIVVS